MRKMLFVMYVCLAGTVTGAEAENAILDKQAMLDRQTFWDNRDWDWYKASIPFLETPDADIDTTYYYRWEMMTKHLVYGSPESGYTYTEFIDRPRWSGRYGAISCPVGHQLYDLRWFKDHRLSQDYCYYWFRTKGAQPHRYSCWLEEGIWAVYRVQHDNLFIKDIRRDVIENFQTWKKKHYDEDFGMFWQHGMADGMETNINSRMTDNWFSGAIGYRPTLNGYLYAGALAIAEMARLDNDRTTAQEYQSFAENLKQRVQDELWDPQRQFFFHMFKFDETKKNEDYVIKARTLTHETGPHAGCGHGREEIGYIPWLFNMPDAGYEAAWKFLMDPDYFYADYGPTVTERNDPMFRISPRCCVWSGNSWPYATSQTLKAMANLLNNYEQDYVDRDDYFELLKIYTMTHRLRGEPYIAEACHPDTGSWEGHNRFNHSEHYFHSFYNDLIITGLIGLHPRAADALEVNPLVPDAWDYFALDDVLYHGNRVSVVWDRTGEKYHKGKGLLLFVNDQKVASRDDIGPLQAAVASRFVPNEKPMFNFAVNNEDAYYPRVKSSSTAPDTSALKAQDGAYWYHISPPNRWASADAGTKSEWVEVDFGVERPVRLVKLYLLDDTGKVDFVAPPGYSTDIYRQTEPTDVAAPDDIQLEYYKDRQWRCVPGVSWKSDNFLGGRPAIATFPEIPIQRMRAVLTPKKGKTVGLSEFETWGYARLPLPKAASVKENLNLGENIALNKDNQGYPRVAVSYVSEFDKPFQAIDGIVSFQPGPHNRWTTFKTQNPFDWIEVDFGEIKNVHTVLLYIWGDKGGVKSPADYAVQYWRDENWQPAENRVKDPAVPAGNSVNIFTMKPVDTRKVRVVMTHQSGSSSGLTELEIYGDNE